MLQPRDRTPVHRVTVTIAGERRDFERPWIAVDHAAMTLHVWILREDPRPTLSVPLLAAVIEWSEPPPESGPTPDPTAR